MISSPTTRRAVTTARKAPPDTVGDSHRLTETCGFRARFSEIVTAEDATSFALSIAYCSQKTPAGQPSTLLSWCGSELCRQTTNPAAKLTVISTTWRPKKRLRGSRSCCLAHRSRKQALQRSMQSSDPQILTRFNTQALQHQVTLKFLLKNQGFSDMQNDTMLSVALQQTQRQPGPKAQPFMSTAEQEHTGS